MQLNGKTALITGSSNGIGFAIAQQLLSEGCNLICNYLHNSALLEELQREAGLKKKKVQLIRADITDNDAVAQMFVTIKSVYPKIDILINNAGVFSSQDAPERLDVFEEVFRVNFFAQVNVTNEAIQSMDAGKIIFISSVHGEIGQGRPGAIAYSASKAALNSYAKNLAKYLAPKILVNVVAPGKTLTPMWGKLSDEEKNELTREDLIKRFIDPAEIADGVSFVLKNDALCGSTLTIDAGSSLA